MHLEASHKYEAGRNILESTPLRLMPYLSYNKISQTRCHKQSDTVEILKSQSESLKLIGFKQKHREQNRAHHLKEQ